MSRTHKFAYQMYCGRIQPMPKFGVFLIHELAITTLVGRPHLAPVGDGHVQAAAVFGIDIAGNAATAAGAIGRLDIHYGLCVIVKMPLPFMVTVSVPPPPVIEDPPPRSE